MQFGRGRAQCATHDEPHHELDPFGPRLAQIFDMRHPAEAIGIGDQVLEIGLVERLVDEPGPGPLELVAHAARSPDLHVEIFRIARHGPRDRLAELPAAVAGGRRVGDDVHRQRHHLHRPGLRLPEHQRQRHRQPVIDIHPIDHRQVEFVEDAALGDVPGEIRVALDHRHLARAPALVGRLELLGAADGEGRDDAHVEGGGMVVIDQHDDVGLFLLLPRLHPFVALEDRLQIGLLVAPVIQRRADRRYVAGGDARGDTRHVSGPP